MDLDSVFDFLKNHKIATSTISSIGALITFITRYPEPSKKILLIVLRLLLKYMPKDIDMTEQSIKSCYGGKNNWVSRVLSCLGYFAKFLIPLVCVSYFIFPSWLFVGVLLLIVVLLVLGLSLVIVASRIEVEKVIENKDIELAKELAKKEQELEAQKHQEGKEAEKKLEKEQYQKRIDEEPNLIKKKLLINNEPLPNDPQLAEVEMKRREKYIELLEEEDNNNQCGSYQYEGVDLLVYQRFK